MPLRGGGDLVIIKRRGMIIEAIARALDRQLGGAPPPPWLAWLALCLCRQRARQSWLVDVARDRLTARDSDSGAVPALSGWTYRFHGIGLCLNGPNGEMIDFDFHDSRGATIDPYFFAQGVFSFVEPPFVERRLRRWLPSAELIVVALGELRSLGVIGHPTSKHVFLLDPRLEELHEEAAALEVDGPHQREIALALGDAELTGLETAPVLEAHRRFLRSALRDRSQAVRVLSSLRGLLPDDEVRAITEALIAGPIDHATGPAIEQLDRLEGPPAPAIEALLDRLHPDRHHPYAASEAAKYLLRRDRHRDRALDLVFAFAAVDQVAGYHGNPFDDELAMVVLEHAPDRALPLIRRALRSKTPIAVQRIAALLALMDRPWCHREIESALRDPSAPDVTSKRYLAAALRASQSELARRRGQMQEPGPPEHEPGAIGFTFDEVVHHNLEDSFGEHLDALRPLAERLAEVDLERD
jgi:hypothetical protein